MKPQTAIPAALLLAAAGALAQTVAVPNASFERGRDAPAAWRRSGAGEWLAGGAADGRRAVAATGTGRDHSYWRSEPLKLEPRAVYCLRFRARGIGAAGGTAVSGPLFCNRDLGVPPARWAEYESYFAAPAEPTADETRLRFGQWHVSGTVAFDDVRLLRAIPVHVRQGGLVLGAGERVAPAAGRKGSAYSFVAPFRQGCGNYSRPLARHRCTLNTDRWVLSPGGEVVYRHEAGGCRQTAAEVRVGVTWHARGELVVQAGPDGKAWRELGALGALGERSFAIPADLQPARQIWVRLTVRAKPGDARRPAEEGLWLQVGQYAFASQLDAALPATTGSTHFVTVPRAAGPLRVRVEALGDATPGGENVLLAGVTNPAAQPVSARLTTTVIGPDGQAHTARRDVAFRPGRQTLRAPYDLQGKAGRYVLRLALDGAASFLAETTLNVPALHDSSYGELLPASTRAAKLWWCSSGWKVSRTRPAPAARGEALLIRAARNEAEAAQLVVRPARALKGLRATAGPLAGPGGAVLPAASVEILRVRYVPVTQPTDGSGTVGDWPDPLPPLRGPLDLPAGRNQPLWVRVKPPKNAAAGTYSGAIRLTAAGGFGADVPLRVEVYGFTLPDRMTCVTAFGFSPGNVWRYQKVRGLAQRRAVLDKYLASFGAHHISPYDPAPLDAFGVHWPKASDWSGGRRDRTVKRSGAGSLKVEDASPTAGAGAGYGPRIAIPLKGLRLRFGYRTGKAGHAFLVTLNHHDAGGQWMSGRNNDMRVTGDGTWQAFDRTITRFAEGAKSVRLTLWPCLYSEQGTTTGTVWYDDLSLIDAGTGRELVRGGDFEPLQPDQLQPRIDWSAWDRAMTRAVDHYHFNSFRIRIVGMGGGTFHSRVEPSLLGYREDTPEYRAAFGSYCRAVQEHLRRRGWLDEAFVYWFDEPDPKDYAFVNKGFRKLKAAAPGIQRMLTEQVEDALAGGPSIWCPLTPHYHPARAEQRRKHGEKFWWYVCTGPKAPYCTLFIDHAATELRVWLWQTFKRRIDGILVWQTNYWTSGAAYPDPARPQDPYADPMGWVSGYSTPAGTRRAWGNGDGRFIYPPEAAADARQEQTVLDGPVDSIRWEMLRDGIEDYEYLTMLRRLLEARRGAPPPPERARYAALLNVPETITRDLTHFTEDPAPIERHRHAVAKAIESLGKGR